jgi:hypothetical protein
MPLNPDSVLDLSLIAVERPRRLPFRGPGFDRGPGSLARSAGR